MLFIARYKNQILVMSEGKNRFYIKTFVDNESRKRSYEIELNEGFEVLEKNELTLRLSCNNKLINIYPRDYYWIKPEGKIFGINFGIDAPRDVIVDRYEIYQKKQKNPHKVSLSYDQIIEKYSDELSRCGI